MKCAEPNIQFPQNDKVNGIFNIIYGLPAAQALLVAHEVGLFKLVSKKKEISLDNIANALQIELRPAQALISMCNSLDLIQKNKNNNYELSELAINFLLEESPFYLGGVLDTMLMNYGVYSCESFKQAILTNTSQVYKGEELFQTHETQEELTKVFTRSMHGKSMAMAGMWPKKIDLSQNKVFLDIGGGSGAHSIGAVLEWPNLQAIVYDRPIVCEVAQEYINQLKLNKKIKVHVADMWQDSFPPADVHFYCDIFHDWTVDKCKFLIEKSYKELKTNGRIIIHEMCFNDDKTGPAAVSSYNIMMLLWTEGQQHSSKELIELLTKIGFADIETIPTGFGDWSLITGIKK